MFRRFLNVIRSNRLDAEIREEIEIHRSQSSGSIGNATLVAEGMREASVIVGFETMLQDVRYGFRQLLKSPAVLIFGVLSVALGV